MTRREEFTAWICAQTGSAYVWGAQGHKVRRDGTVYMNQRKVSDNFESWVKQNNQTTTSNFPCNFNFTVSNMNRFN